MALSFLKDFNKNASKIEGVSSSSSPPRYWFSTGNFVLNKIISGSYFKGIPQGRLVTFAGPSSAGKSFLTGNVVKAAQQEGAGVLIIDSENAMDDMFMSAIGVNVDHEDYVYKSVVTVSQAQHVISSYIKEYKKTYGNDKDAPRVIICIDSLSMLLTDTELENYEKGVQKGDMGQKSKQLKALLRALVQDIKELNITIVNTLQVYKNTDLLNGEGTWIVSDGVRFSASQIVLLTKLKLRDTGSRDVEGIRMKCEGFKTRFTKPFQIVTIDVPYETGMDQYSGLLEVALSTGVIEKAGSRYKLAGADNSWYSKDFNQYADSILSKLESQAEQFISVMDENAEEVIEDEPSSKELRTQKFEDMISSQE